ncbi:hypothetical protein EVAR_85087_1 [Eumeta japonica]|uniref:Uncharacterized protein n=1 Tax=Eumeta variegata TaxID=151549 RepID=A0A4C1XAL2_EUMVA|nr:hypothetical protein EVAR_85087_1 [Eumeta japonica]
MAMIVSSPRLELAQQTGLKVHAYQSEMKKIVGGLISAGGNCGAMWMPKAGMKCSVVCFHCSGETCSNVMELSELINENDFDDEPPTLTPFLIQFSHWYLIQKPDQMLSRSLVHRND